MGFKLTNLGLSVSKSVSKNFIKFDIAEKLIGSTLSFLRVIFLGLLVNELTNKTGSNTSYFYLGILATIELLNSFSRNYLSEKSNFYRGFTKTALFEITLEKYRQIPIKFRNDPKFVELERNLNVNAISFFIENFIRLLSGIYSLILSFIAITFIDFKLFFIAVVIGAISFYLKAIMQVRMFADRDERGFNETLIRKNQSNFKYDYVDSFGDNLIINDNYDFINKKYQQVLENYTNYNINYYNKVVKIRGYSNYILDVAETVTMVLLYLKGINGDFQIGTLTILAASYSSFTNGLANIANFGAGLLGQYLEIKSFNDLLEFSFENNEMQEIKKRKDFIIEFKNVSFKYPETEVYALKNINLKIENGDKIGVIGENGAGKSTLVKLLFRIYEPTEGIITLNNQNILEIRDEDYYGVLKILSQNQSIEDTLSINELIHLGNSTQKYNQKLIKWAASMSGSKSFIENFKDGYNQKIAWGMWFLNKFSEIKYVTLSPGQERRIEISRIFYSKKPIIVLDEPTSNVDPLASKEIFENLKYLKNNQILILIAHDVLRLNNIANKILVLGQGQIIEFGDRENLIKDPNSKYSQTLLTYNSKDIVIEKE